MSQRVTAVVEQGRLRPTTPLGLAEGTEVEVVILHAARPQAEPSRPRRDAKDILAEIAALPLEEGGEEFGGRDHDRILYGDRGAR